MEYIEGCNIKDYMSQYSYSIPMEKIKEIIRCLLKGLIYLHENSVIHRDLKLGNLFVDDHHVVSNLSHMTSSTPRTQCYFCATHIDVVGVDVVRMCFPWHQRELHPGVVVSHQVGVAVLALQRRQFPVVPGLRLAAREHLTTHPD